MCTVLAMASGTGFGAAPVKNTFIHFEAAEDSKTRFLRRARTDPESPPPPLRRLPAKVHSPEAPAQPVQGKSQPSRQPSPEARLPPLPSTPVASPGSPVGTPRRTPPRPAPRPEEGSPDISCSPTEVAWDSTPPGSPQVSPCHGQSQMPEFYLPIPAFPAALAPPFPAEPSEGAASTPPTPLPLAALTAPPQREPTPIKLAEEIPSDSTCTPPYEPPPLSTPVTSPWRHPTPEWTPEPPSSRKAAQPAPAPAPGPFLQFKDGFLFGFTLRKADGACLGIKCTSSDGGRTLLVQSVQAGGAIEAWNRQVVGSATNNGKAVVPGDKLVCANAVHSNGAVVGEECRKKLLVKLLFARGGLPYDTVQPRLEKMLGPAPGGTSAVVGEIEL